MGGASKRDPALRREITIALAVKALAIAIIFWLFFAPEQRPQVGSSDMWRVIGAEAQNAGLAGD